MPPALSVASTLVILTNGQITFNSRCLACGLHEQGDTGQYLLTSQATCNTWNDHCQFHSSQTILSTVMLPVYFLSLASLIFLLASLSAAQQHVGWPLFA